MLRVRYHAVYRFVKGIFANDLMISLAYHVETGVLEWARNRIPFPIITL